MRTIIVHAAIASNPEEENFLLLYLPHTLPSVGIRYDSSNFAIACKQVRLKNNNSKKAKLASLNWPAVYQVFFSEKEEDAFALHRR